VVGNRATSKCDIVTRNQIIYASAAISGTVPTDRSAIPAVRSTIRTCPEKKFLRRLTVAALRKKSVQRVVAALERPAQGHCRVKLLKLSLQMLVDQQQRFQRTVQVAVTTGDDFVDGGFTWSGTHRKSSVCTAGIIFGARTVFLWIVWKIGR
jgi:hypothetical protein